MAELFRNVDSSINVSAPVWLYCLDGTWTYPHVPDIPVLLVSPETMDRVCPPERRAGLAPECWRELSRIVREVESERYERWEDRERARGRALEELWTRAKRCEITYAARGAFLERCEKLGVSGPAILICPERVGEAAGEAARALGVPPVKAFRSLLKATLVHEQAHAYTWKCSMGRSYREYSKPYVRAIEEFVAQYTAWSHLGKAGKLVFSKSEASQPLEYRSWKLPIALNSHHRLYSYVVVRAWSQLVASALQPTPDICRLHFRLVRFYIRWEPLFQMLECLLSGCLRGGYDYCLQLVAYRLLNAAV